jgi:hypothetical protein
MNVSYFTLSFSEDGITYLESFDCSSAWSVLDASTIVCTIPTSYQTTLKGMPPLPKFCSSLSSPPLFRTLAASWIAQNDLGVVYGTTATLIADGVYSSIARSGFVFRSSSVAISLRSVENLPKLFIDSTSNSFNVRQYHHFVFRP